MAFESDALNNVFLVPKSVEKHLKTASETELRVILYIFSKGGNVGTNADISKALSLSENDVCSAVAFWRGAGIIKQSDSSAPEITVKSETPVSQKTASYSSAELAAAINGNDDVRSLLNFASQKIGKILTPSEQAAIYSLVDVFSMKCDLVMGIIEYCVSEGHPSARYIEKTGAKMYTEDGIDSYKKLEEYLRRKKDAKSYEEKVRRIIGASGRAFTKKECEIVESFSRNGIAEELIAAAYERTISSISKPSLQYMAKIIEKWQEKGINSVSDLEGNKPYQKENMSSITGFSLSEFAEGPDAPFFSEKNIAEKIKNEN